MLKQFRIFIMMVLCALVLPAFADDTAPIVSDNASQSVAGQTALTGVENQQGPAATQTDEPTDVSINDDMSCSVTAFNNALAAGVRAGAVTADTDEYAMRDFIYSVIQSPNVAKIVAACPEIANSADDDTIYLPPISYVFPSADGAEPRTITINYTTQAKIIRQRATIADKKYLPAGAPSEIVGPNDNGTTWSNTEPAWYGIMVVQHGTMDAYVGADKPNTISLQYLADNWKNFYPAHHNTTSVLQMGGVMTAPMCTSTSALADDGDIVNMAAHKTVQEPDSTWKGNDYYVAGDVNLQWITWTEVGLDVAITVVTMGAGEAAMMGAKGLRAGRAIRNVGRAVDVARDTADVKRFEQLGRRAQGLNRALEEAQAADDVPRIARITNDIRSVTEESRTLENTSADVKKYQEAVKGAADLEKYKDALNAFKAPQKGNVLARNVRRGGALLRSVRAGARGGREIRAGNKIAHAANVSGRARDFLFNSSVKFLGILGKTVRGAGVLYGALKFLGDMYDYSETSTGDYTSNLDFKPLLLLSADDLTGEENVVAHGMWIMFAGSSTAPADDDAAYLQAMDFAQKFSEDMTQTQEDTGRTDCNVDIYVVRPIIRNPDSDNPELYYLIMNDEPWTI